MDINKGLLLDVFDLYCYDSETGKLLFMSENLTQSSISGTADESEVRNGRGNNLFATVSPDCKPTPFAKNIFDELYRNHDEDYNINMKDFEKKLK